MTPRRPVTFAEFLFRKLGYRKGTKVAAFVVAWGIYTDSLQEGRRASMFGYANYWKQSQATSYRELEVFHEAFPDEVLPDRVWSVVGRHVEERKSRAVAAAQALPVVSRW